MGYYKDFYTSLQEELLELEALEFYTTALAKLAIGGTNNKLFDADACRTNPDYAKVREYISIADLV